MSLAAGSLSHRIQIRYLLPIKDELTGNIEEDWPLFAEVWADVRPASVREFLAAGANSSKVTVSVKIRYRDGIKPSMRIWHKDHVYNIEGVLPDPGSGNEYITLPCSEVVNG